MPALKPVEEYAKFQAQWERELRQALRDAARQAELQIGRAGAGLRGARTIQIAKETSDMAFHDLYTRLRSGRADIAGLAGKIAAEADAELFRTAGMSEDFVAAYVRAEATRAAAQVDRALTRITTSRIPLSEQVYKTRQLTNGLVDRRVNAMLAAGMSQREIAKGVRDLISPNVPGGVSYAALRLGRTEINNAAHASAINRGRSKPWVHGFDWHLSGSHPRTDICNDIELGSPYSKEDVPDKPHPQCLCYVTAASDDEALFQERLLNGDYDAHIDDVMRQSGYTEEQINASRFSGSSATRSAPVRTVAAKADPLRLPSTFDHFPTGKPVAHDEAMKIANQGLRSAAKADQLPYQVNCTKVTHAYELLRRGTIVQAKSGNAGLPWSQFPKRWVRADGTAPDFYHIVSQTAGSSIDRTLAAKDIVNAATARDPDGARYIAYTLWDGGKTAHVFNAEKIDGIIEMFDAQTGVANADHFLGQAERFGIMRVDDAIPHADSSIYLNPA